MTQKRSKPARVNGTGSGNVISSAARDTRISTLDLAEAQASFLAARFGLDGVRARVVAELAWGAR